MIATIQPGEKNAALLRGETEYQELTMDANKPDLSILLGYLYDVLDEEERRDVEAMLASSPAWQAALEQARNEQDLIASASKCAFPEVQFQPPRETQTAKPTKTPGRAPRRRWSRPMAIAASLLVLVTGACVIAAAINLYPHWQKKREADQRLAQLEEKRKALAERQDEVSKRMEEVRRQQQRLRELEQRWISDKKSVADELKKQPVELIIQGPQTIEAGARNEYRIETRVRQGDRLPAPPMDMKIKVVDPELPAKQQVLYETQLETQTGLVKVELPPDLPATPGRRLKMQVVAIGKAGVKAAVEEELPLVGRRYLTHLTTDRPLYLPGETVRFRSLTLERVTLKPATQPLHLRFRVLDARGGVVRDAHGKKMELIAASRISSNPDDPLDYVKGPDGRPITGIGAGEFTLPPDLPGGEYTLEVAELNDKFPTEKRKFIVNRYQLPRLNKKLEFHRKSYGPGDEVVLNLSVESVTGKKVLHQPVTVKAFADDHQEPFAVETVMTDGQGRVPPVRFRLPEQIERSATVVAEFRDEAGPDTPLVRPIPLVLGRLLINFYPEGGDLIAGVENHVYFEVRKPDGKPAEMRGRILDDRGRKIVAVETFHDDTQAGANQGMGVCRFIPEAGRRYHLLVDTPIGIKEKHHLPAVQTEGVVLHSKRGVVSDHIDLRIASVGTDRKLLVGAYCRGRVMAQQTFDAPHGKAIDVRLTPAGSIGGVYRVTVFERTKTGHWVPRAERLIYRHTPRRLNLHVTTDRSRYSPGERVRVRVAGSDEKGKKAPFVALAVVADESTIKLADDKTLRSMPTHFLLTTEVKNPDDLEYADFLLSDHPKAETALDLLLGTQGWRRFLEQDPMLQQPRPEQDDAERFLAVAGLKATKTSQTEVRTARVDARYLDEALAAKYRFLQANKTRAATLAELRGEEQQLLQDEAELTWVRRETAHTLLQAAVQYGRILLLAWGGALVLVGLVLCFLSLARRPEPEGSRKSKGKNTWVGIASGVVGVMLVFGGLRLFIADMNTAMDRAGVAMAKRDMAEDALAIQELEVDEKMQGRFPLLGAAPGAIGDLERGAMGGGLVAKRGMPRQGEERRAALLPAPPPGDARGFAKVPVAKELQRRRDAGIGFLRAEPDFGAPEPLAVQDLPDMNRRADRPGIAGENIAQLLPEWSADWRPAFVVREYAHQNRRKADGVRRDFSQTLYWNPVLVAREGNAEFAFDLSVTTFRITIWGHTSDGRLGAIEHRIVSKLPFSINPRVPLAVADTDEITIPVAVTNETAKKATIRVRLDAEHLAIEGSKERELTVGPNGQGRSLFQLRPKKGKVTAKVRVSATMPGIGSDAVEHTIPVEIEGFPREFAASDTLEGQAVHTVELPDKWVPGSLAIKAEVFQSTLAELHKGLEGMLREPHGCFEQTSSSNYPNVMILSYLQESHQVNPEVEKRARALLQKGYRKLISFECLDVRDRNRRGYEWFGGTNPPHEALTAYGLLQFKDMARFQDVDEEMMRRTEKFLLDRRNPDGTFKRSARAIDQFGRAPDHITNAYIVWALTEYGTKADLSPQFAYLGKEAKKRDDPYFLALVALSYLNAGKGSEAMPLLERIAKSQAKDGRVPGKETSITRSQGKSLDIETTSLVLLAWLRANRPDKFTQSIQKAADWIGRQRSGFGMYGSTQSTILALKALADFAKARRLTTSAGEVKLYIGNTMVDQFAYPAKYSGKIVVTVPEDKLHLLRPGKNVVKIVFDSKDSFPYTLSWSYRVPRPDNPPQCPVKLETTFDRGEVKEGETVRLTVKVTNTSGKGQGMAIARVGLPGGVNVPEDLKQLRALTQPQGDGPAVIDHFEVRGRELVLYWRSMAPRATRQATIDLVCRIPGRYRGPASQAYLYYQNELRFWTAPLEVTIAPSK